MRKFISFVCAFALLLSMFCVGGISFASAEILQEGDFEYEPYGDGWSAAIVGYRGDSHVEIPDEIGGYSVVAIGYEAFAGRHIDHLYLPCGLQRVEDRAFADCFIGHIYFAGVIPTWKDVSIGSENDVLLNNPIHMFGCDNFSISFQNDEITITAWGEYGDYIGDLVIPSEIEGFPVRTIACNAFEGRRIYGVTIMPGVTHIEDGAFRDCQLEYATFIGSPSEFIHMDIDRNNGNLQEILRIRGENGLWMIADEWEGITIISYDDYDHYEIDLHIPSDIDGIPVRTIASNAFEWASFESLTLPSSITRIENHILSDYFTGRVYYEGSAYEWSCIDIADDNYTLFNALRLRNDGDFLFSIYGGGAVITGYEGWDYDLVIPSEIEGFPVTTIASNAFQYRSFNTVTLPSTIRLIDERAFTDCEIQRTYYEASIYDWWYNVTVAPENDALTAALAFEHGVFLIAPYYGDSYCVTVIDYLGGDTVDTLEIPEYFEGWTITAIAPHAFENMYINNVILSPSINYIGENAFAGCTINRSYLRDEGVYDWNTIQIEWGNEALTDARVFHFDWYGYQIRNGEAVIINSMFAYEPPTEFEIPSDFYGYPVTTISSEAFAGHYVNTVILPDTITHIESRAFADCGLFRLMYPGTPANWSRVTVDPDNEDIDFALTLKYNDFWYQSFSSNDVSIVGYDAPWDNYILHLDIPTDIDGRPVTSIYYNAFGNLSYLETISLPLSITSIDSNAMPLSLHTVYYAGSEQDRYNIHFGYENTGEYCTWIYNTIDFGEQDDFSYIVTTSNTATILKYNGWDSVLTVPTTLGGYPVTAIAEYAFLDSYVFEVTLPDSLTTIGDYAFAASDIEQITIPNSVTSIGAGAFEGCSSLQSVTLPSSITTISDRLFGYCYSLCDITIPEGVQSIGDEAFESCGSLPYIRIPEGVTSIGKSAFYNCRGLQYIQLPASLKFVDVAFYDTAFFYVYYSGTKADRQAMTIYDSNLNSSSIIWYYNVASIGLACNDAIQSGDIYAYYITHDGTATITECFTGDTHVDLPSTLSGYPVTAIDYAALWGAVNAESFTIPDSIISIEPRAFENTACYKNEDNWEDYGLYIDGVLIAVKGVKSDRFPVHAGTRMIANEVFSGTGIATIEIPKSVNVIGDNAFNVSSASALCGIYYGGTKDDWKTIHFGENADVSNRIMVHFTTPVLGDANGDGVITTSDARIALTVALDDSWTAEELAMLDMNGDGKISTEDVRLMMIKALNS